MGENGSGQSTLLGAIAVNAGLNPVGGSRNLRFRHPVFGHMDVWVSQKARPFFDAGVREGQEAAVRGALRALDKAIREACS